jgi:mRNA interferase RelE/StbE
LAWTIEFDRRAARDLAKLDKPMQREIQRYLDERIAPASDPKAFGHALGGNLSGIWRYRVRDYRILCHFDDETLTILVIEIGHRSEIYDR